MRSGRTIACTPSKFPAGSGPNTLVACDSGRDGRLGTALPSGAKETILMGQRSDRGMPPMIRCESPNSCQRYPISIAAA